MNSIFRGVLFILLGAVTEMGSAQGPCRREPISGEKVAGVGYRLVLDRSAVPFPDIVYGFIVIENNRTEAAYLPVPGSETGGLLRLRCCEAELDNDFTIRGIGHPGQVRIKPPNFFSVSPFRFNWLTSEVVERVREGFVCEVISTVRIRPLNILVERKEDGPPFRYEVLGEGEPLIAKAETQFKYDMVDTIFTNPRSELAEIALAPPAWRSPEALASIIRWKTCLDDQPTTASEMVNNAALSDVPILSVFPERVETIQQDIRRDTSTWRYLELTKLIRHASTEPQSKSDVDKMVAKAVAVLKQSGPAELIYLDQYFFSQIDHAWSGGGPVVPEQQGYEIRTYFINRWTEEIGNMFSGVPLHSKLGAPNYGDDGNYLELDQIDINRLRILLANLRGE